MWSEILILSLFAVSSGNWWTVATAEPIAVKNLKSVNAFYKIEAEDFDVAVQAGENTVYCASEGIIYVASDFPSANLGYYDVDFGTGAEFITVRFWGYEDNLSTGRINFHLESATNSPFVSITVGPTGYEDCAFITVTDILPYFVSGVNDLYITFTSPNGVNVAGIDWFYFNQTTVVPA